MIPQRRRTLDRSSVHQSVHRRKVPDAWQIAAVVIALLAAAFAGWSSYEAREARLDVKRAQLRSEALEFLADLRTVRNMVECYSFASGVLIPDKETRLASLAESVTRIRQAISEVPRRNAVELELTEVALNRAKGQPLRDLQEKLPKFRAQMSKEVLERIDALCKY